MFGHTKTPVCLVSAALAMSCVGQTDAVGPHRGLENRVDQTAVIATRSGARRLSRAELDHVLRDLLGDTTSPATRLLPDSVDEFAPYDNDYTKQRASRTLIESLEVLAEDVGARAAADPAVRERIVPCTPSTDGDAECFREFVSTFVARALRRPLASEDVDAYMPLLAFATEDNEYVDNDFYTAVDLTIRAVVQDPELLYRIEVGTPGEAEGVAMLTEHELATRMSFLLWGTTPSDGLLEAADRGELREESGRRAMATEMLDDPRAREQLHRFHAMWLGYRAIPASPELVGAFDRETSALIDRVVFDEDLDYMSIFTFDQTYVDATLAAHYGIPAPSSGSGWVEYPADSGRAGILSHGAVLSAFSKFTDTSPTQRGIFVRTRLMCSPVGSPPPTVDVDKPPGQGTDAVCKSERYSLHRDMSTSCAGCHSQMDPIGFGLERFDVNGRFRTHDDGHPECAIDGQGQLPGSGSFSGPRELANLLVENGEIEDCLMRQLWTFGNGRTPTRADEVEIAEMLQRFRGGDRSMRTLLVDWVASPRFALRAEEEAQ